MSWRVVDWVMEQDVTDHQAKLLMMVLGTHADDAGRCYPRISLVARECSMSVRTAHRVLGRIKDRYALVMTWEAQNGSSNIYQFRCPDFRNLAKSSSANMVAEGSANSQAKASSAEFCQQMADPPLPIRWQNKNRHQTINSTKQRDQYSVPRARGWPNEEDRNTEPRKGGMANALAKLKSTFTQGDRGTIEMQIADRIGPNGLEVLTKLYELDPNHVDMLCALQRRGNLTERDIVKLRRQRSAS